MATVRAYRFVKVVGTPRRRPFLRGVAPAGVAEVAAENPSAMQGDAEAAAEAAPAVAVARRRGKRWTVWRVLRWTLGVSFLLVVGYGVWLVTSFVRLEDRIYVPLPPTPTAASVAIYHATATAAEVAHVTPPPTPTDPFADLPAGRINILLLGTDVRPNDPDHYGRTDTIILLNLETATHKVRLMTIPRDLVVNIPGYGRTKINAAYFDGQYFKEPGGGTALMMRTVSQLLSVPVDYYIVVNFEGFRALIDTLGGVDVNVPYEIYDPAYPSENPNDPYGTIQVHFKPGWQHLDGTLALRYARTRHADSDFGRSKRQLQIIMAARDKALHVDLVPELPALMDKLGDTLQTNIPFDQQLALARAAYEVRASDILTTTIDNSLVSVQWLPDGSEGVKLNWKKAQPIFDNFFGRKAASPNPSATANQATARSSPPSGGASSSAGLNLIGDSRPPGAIPARPVQAVVPYTPPAPVRVVPRAVAPAPVRRAPVVQWAVPQRRVVTTVRRTTTLPVRRTTVSTRKP